MTTAPTFQVDVHSVAVTISCLEDMNVIDIVCWVCFGSGSVRGPLHVAPCPNRNCPHRRRRRTNQRGATLLEVFGVVTILGIIFTALTIAVTAGMTRANQQAAEHEALAWARSLELRQVRVSCGQVDSDGDGYVSCSVRHEGGLEAAECRGAASVGHGCRVPKMRGMVLGGGR